MTLHKRRFRIANLTIADLLVIALCTSCTSLGIRPDAVGGAYSTATKNRCTADHGTTATTQEIYRACLRYREVWNWGTGLKEAYRSRATMNEWSIYVAGTLALASLGSVAGLAAAGAAAATATGVIPVAGGFTSGVFTLLNNQDKAAAYTQAANDIAQALADSEKTLSGATPQYDTARSDLLSKITTAQNTLETARSTLASAAATKQEIQKATQAMKEAQSQLQAAILQNVLARLRFTVDPSQVKKDPPTTLTIKFSEASGLKQVPCSDIIISLDDDPLKDFSCPNPSDAAPTMAGSVLWRAPGPNPSLIKVTIKGQTLSDPQQLTFEK